MLGVGVGKQILIAEHHGQVNLPIPRTTVRPHHRHTNENWGWSVSAVAAPLLGLAIYINIYIYILQIVVERGVTCGREGIPSTGK